MFLIHHQETGNLSSGMKGSMNQPMRMRKEVIPMPDILVCHLNDNIPILCRPDKRKTESIFPKWFCFVCNRYVLPDGIKHEIAVEDDNKLYPMTP